MSLISIILLVVLLLILFGGFAPIRGGNFYGTGWQGGGLISVLIIVLLVLALSGRL